MAFAYETRMNGQAQQLLNQAADIPAPLVGHNESHRTSMNAELSPARILDTAASFFRAKVLLSAVELGTFTRLAEAPLEGSPLAAALGIRPDTSADLFVSPVALACLER